MKAPRGAHSIFEPLRLCARQPSSCPTDMTHRPFSAEIPCFRELTGKSHFFERRLEPEMARKAAEIGRFEGNSRQTEQGIQKLGTGNSKVRNWEFESAEQGIRFSVTGNSFRDSARRWKYTAHPEPVEGRWWSSRTRDIAIFARATQTSAILPHQGRWRARSAWRRGQAAGRRVDRVRAKPAKTQRIRLANL
jgi:hypothetical protein